MSGMDCIPSRRTFSTGVAKMKATLFFGLAANLAAALWAPAEAKLALRTYFNHRHSTQNAAKQAGPPWRDSVGWNLVPTMF